MANSFASNFPFAAGSSSPELIPCSVGSSSDWFDDTATNRSVVLNSDQDDDDWLILTNNEKLSSFPQFQQHPKRVSLDTCDMWMDDPTMDIDDLSFLDDDDEMNVEDQTYSQWLEHRNRLSSCMKKSQETRKTLCTIQELTKAFTQTQESMLAVREKVLTEAT